MVWGFLCFVFLCVFWCSFICFLKSVSKSIVEEKAHDLCLALLFMWLLPQAAPALITELWWQRQQIVLILKLNVKSVN